MKTNLRANIPIGNRGVAIYSEFKWLERMLFLIQISILEIWAVRQLASRFHKVEMQEQRNRLLHLWAVAPMAWLMGARAVFWTISSTKMEECPCRICYKIMNRILETIWSNLEIIRT